MPAPQLTQAINNNRGLYRAIFRANGVRLESNHQIYYCESQPPPLYSSIATRSPAWRLDETFQSICASAERGRRPEWSVKDSFQCLDLSGHGFTKLFDAQWFYLSAADFRVDASGNPLRFRRVDRESGLAEWIDVWGEGTELGGRIFKPALLFDPNVEFVVGSLGENPACVALLNRTDDVIGVSNFFAPKNTAATWSALVCHIIANHKPSAIVGYERAETISAIRPLGALPVGDLTVWLKKLTADRGR